MGSSGEEVGLLGMSGWRRGSFLNEEFDAVLCSIVSRFQSNIYGLAYDTMYN